MVKTIKIISFFIVSFCALNIYAQKDIDYIIPDDKMGIVSEYPVEFLANDDSVIVRSDNTEQTFVLNLSGNGFHCCALDLNHDGYEDYYFYSDFGGQRDFNYVMIFNPVSKKFEEYTPAENICIDNILVIPSMKKTFVCFYLTCTNHYGAVKFENGEIVNDGLMWVNYWDPMKQKSICGYYDPEKDEIVKKISARRSIYRDVIKIYKSLGH